MAKNKKDEMLEIAVDEALKKSVKPGKLSLDFGREDLNRLAAKVNEIIDYLT